jgi:tetratricopeptide (TPR) repeat protein
VVVALFVVLLRKRMAERAPASKKAKGPRTRDRSQPPPSRGGKPQSPRPPPSDPSPDAVEAPSLPRREAPSVTRRDPHVQLSTPPPSLGRPTEARHLPEDATEAEAAYRRALAGSTGSAADKDGLQSIGRHAAKLLLDRGQPRRAVQILREIDLVDQAIHVYLNVLNEPLEAATLLAARGDHLRAAELYGSAGAKEESARSWLEVARAENDPLRYLVKIQPLNERMAHEMLVEASLGREIDESSLDLFYQLALSHLLRGHGAEARDLLEHLHEVAPTRRDIEERLRGVRRASGPRAGPVSSPSAAGSSPGTKPPVVSSPIPPASRPPRTSNPAPGTRPPGASNPAPATRASAVSSPAPATRPPGASRPAPGTRPPVTSVPAPTSRPRAEPAEPAGEVTELSNMIAGQSCTLENIEVFYRLGLAYERLQQTTKAVQAFEAVDEASPGYRDAGKRVQRLRGS